MTISRIQKTLHYAGLMTVVALGLAMSGCDKGIATTSAGSSTGDTSMPPERPMLEAGNTAMGNSPATSTNAIASIKVSVKLSPALAKHAAATDAVFIFARATQGPRMPLAIVRKQVKDLPVTVALDDNLSMMPQMKLSSFSEVIVGARVSKSGDAIAQPGDLEGYSAPVHAGNQVVEVIISSVHSDKVGMPTNHPAMEATTDSGFVHPKTNLSSTLSIPSEIKAKWKSVELAITATGGKEQRARVAIGDKVAIANTGLSLSVDAFVPAFMSDAGVVTSSSNQLDNPAVELQLRDHKGKIAEGWVFQNLADFNSFSSSQVSVRLLSAEAK